MPKRAYVTYLLPKHLEEDIKQEAQRLDINESEVIERRFYGYEVKEEAAAEAAQALIVQKNNEDPRYQIIEEWWQKTTKKLGTEIVKSCRDILAESVDHDT